jgi:hypothetical protein
MVGSNTPMPRRFRFALLALLVLPATGIAACGSSSTGSTSASDLLKATFGPNHTVKSGKLAIDLTFDGKGLKSLTGPVALKLTGPFESQGKGQLPKLDLSLALSSSGTNFTAGIVTTGDKGWVRLQGQSFAVDDATFQKFKQGYVKSSAKSGTGTPSFRSLGIDPLHWLKDPKTAGTASVGGADTYHITAGVDVAAFLADVSTLLGKAQALGSSATSLPTTLTPQQRQDIESSVKSASLEIWTGKSDKSLRRVRLDIGIDVPAAVRPRAGGLTTGSLAFDLTISDLNQSQTITPPAKALPLSQLQSLISGGSSGSGSGTTPTPATSPGGSTAYLNCLSAAGSDVAKIQQCASLAGQ